MATLSRWITRLFFDCKMSVTIGSRTILLENRGILVHTLRISSEDAQPHRQGYKTKPCVCKIRFAHQGLSQVWPQLFDR